MKLFSAAGAPSPRRVRMYLAEKGIKVETIDIDLRNLEQNSAAFLALAPRGTVPVLVLDDGTVIDESVSICRYFEALQPEPPLFGTTPKDIALIDAWSRRIENDGYTAVAYVLRNSAPAFQGRAVTGKWPPIPQIPELVTRGRTMFLSFAQALDQHLRNRDYLAGNFYSFADLTGLIAFDFAARAGVLHPEGHDNLERWLAALRQRPSAKA